MFSFPVTLWAFAHLFQSGCWSYWHRGGIVYFWPSQDEPWVRPDGLHNSYPFTGWLPWNSSRYWKVPCGSGHGWRSGVPAKSWRLCQNPPLCLRPARHVSGCLGQPGCFRCEESRMGIRRKQGTKILRCTRNKKEHRFLFFWRQKIKAVW